MTLRRDFLGFTAGAVAARTVLPLAARAETPPFVHAMSPDHPDAKLIAACMAFEEADKALYDPDFDPDAPLDEHCIDWDAALGVVAELRPRTRIGLRAKASVVITALLRDIAPDPDMTMEDEAEPHVYAAWRLANDALLLGAA